jgi:hypothetical protein
MRRQKTRRAARVTHKGLWLAGAVLVGVLIVSNLTLGMLYRERTYPRTRLLGHSVGNMSYQDLAQKAAEQPLPSSLTLTHDDQTIHPSPDELGIVRDPNRTSQAVAAQRSWLPILNLLKTTELGAPVRIDSAVLQAKAVEIAKALRKSPQNAHLTLNQTTVGIADAQPGYELQQSELKNALLKALDKGQARLSVPVTVTQPKLRAESLKAQKEQLEKQLATAVTYRYGNKAKQVPAADIASWFVPAHDAYELDPAKAQAYVTQAGKEFGIRVKDAAGIAAQTAAAVSAHKALDITFVRQQAVKTYSYCTAVRGVDAAQLPVFRSKLQSTLNDSRSWSLGGLIEFREATSGCNFTAWLSAAELMPSFGGVCDAEWSCRSGANVVINFTRWQNASPAWNAASGALDEYRNMVINHETGHWLGFNHDHCRGPGQPAPVMQQQSIDLEGCAFNAWPAADEIAVLRRQLGL